MGDSMNVEKFKDWQTSVVKLNTEAGKIIQDRDNLYEYLSNEVKSTFGKMGLYPEKVHLSSSAHEIRVEFKSEDDVLINPSILSELHMKFKISYGFDKKGNWRVVLVFYPFKD